MFGLNKATVLDGKAQWRMHDNNSGTALLCVILFMRCSRAAASGKGLLVVSLGNALFLSRNRYILLTSDEIMLLGEWRCFFPGDRMSKKRSGVLVTAHDL